MSMSDFDPETFLQQTVDHPLETEFVLIPTGEYLASIDDFDKDAVEQINFTYKQGPRAGQPGIMTKLTLPFVIDNDDVKKELGRDKVVVTRQFILDLDDNGHLADGKNKNVELGRLRDAVGQNDGSPWTIANLRGVGPLMVRVIHREFTRSDGSLGKRAEIDRIARVR
jgi:hypothetical protein